MTRDAANQWPRIQPLLEQHMTQLLAETTADMPTHITIDTTISANRHYLLYSEGLIPKIKKNDELTVQHLRQIVRAHVLRSGKNEEGVALAMAIDPQYRIAPALVKAELIRLRAVELAADLHESEGARKVVVAAAESERGIAQQILDSTNQHLGTKKMVAEIRENARSKTSRENGVLSSLGIADLTTDREITDTTLKTFDAMAHTVVDPEATHEAVTTLVPNATANESEAITTMRMDKHAFMAVINGTSTEQIINVTRLCTWLVDVSQRDIVHPCERAIMANEFALLCFANQKTFGAKMALIFDEFEKVSDS